MGQQKGLVLTEVQIKKKPDSLPKTRKLALQNGKYLQAGTVKIFNTTLNTQKATHLSLIFIDKRYGNKVPPLTKNLQNPYRSRALMLFRTAFQDAAKLNGLRPSFSRHRPPPTVAHSALQHWPSVLLCHPQSLQRAHQPPQVPAHRAPA